MGLRIKKAGLLTKLVVLALLIATATSLLELNGRLQEANAQKDELTQQVAAQAQTNAELEDAIANSDDPERIADVARDRLGLVEPGEIIFYSMTE